VSPGKWGICMRAVGYCLLGALTSVLACGDIDNGATGRAARTRDPSSSPTGGSSGSSNATPGTGGGQSTGGSNIGSGGSTNPGSGGTVGTGAAAGAGGSGGASGNGGVGGSAGSGPTGVGGSTVTTGVGGSSGTATGTTGVGGSSGAATGTTGVGGSGGIGGAGSGGAGGGAATGGSNGVDAGVKIDANGPGGGGALDAGIGSDVMVTDRIAPPSAGMWIAPNHPWYEWNALPAAQVPWQHLTHLGLGYLQPQLSSGKYIAGAPPGWGSDWTGFRDAAKGFADAAHAASRKAFMMLGAAQSNTGDYAGVWNTATSSANIDAFADNIVSVSKEMSLDGVELDWEEDINYAQLVALAKKIRARWADGLIFIDVLPLDDGTGIFTALAPAKDDVDAFMPMTFLPIPQWGGWVLPIPLSPLYGYPGNGYSVDDNLKKWTAAGVPASKVIMGVGGFGSVWGDSNSDRTAPIAPYITVTGTGGADSETGNLYDDRIVTQSWVKGVVNGNPGRMIEAWDDTGKCSYWHAPATNDLVPTTAQTTAIQASLIFYETPRSMTEKLNYARTQGMRGMNFWTLSQTMDGAASPILETIMP
jgi:hypothetical protein